MESVVPIFILGTFAWLGYKVISSGGFKGAVLGGRIAETIGEIPLKNRGPGFHMLRVHKLEGGDIAFEVSSKAAFGFSVTGFSVPPSEAEVLVRLLQKASHA